MYGSVTDPVAAEYSLLEYIRINQDVCILRIMSNAVQFLDESIGILWQRVPCWTHHFCELFKSYVEECKCHILFKIQMYVLLCIIS